MKEQQMFELPETEQKVFDIVKVHLLTQNKKSRNNDCACVYQNVVSGKKMKCAAGALIPDEFYSNDLEGYTWRELVERGDVPSEHLSLICELQLLHDHISPLGWEECLMEIADKFKLKYY